MFSVRKLTERKGKLLRQIWALHTARGNQELGQNSFSRSTGKPVRGMENQLARSTVDFHNMQISDNQHLEKVFKNFRQKLNLSEDSQVLNEKTTNVLIWGLLSSTTMKASVHLGPSYNDIWLRTRTPLSKSSRRCSTSRSVDLGTCIRYSECFHD